MQSKLVAFWSPGSAGVTTITANVSALLARRTTLRIAAVDFNLTAPSLGLALGLFKRYDPLDCCMSAILPGLTAETLTPEQLAHTLLAVPDTPGMKVLAGLFRPLILSQVGPKQVELLLSLLRDQFDLILVDLPAPIDYTTTYVTLEQADQVVWLVSGQVPDRFHLRRYLSRSAELGLPLEKGALVLNRPGPASARQIEFEFGLPVEAEIPVCTQLPPLLEEGAIPSLKEGGPADLIAFRKGIEAVARLIAPDQTLTAASERKLPVRR